MRRRATISPQAIGQPLCHSRTDVFAPAHHDANGLDNVLGVAAFVQIAAGTLAKRAELMVYRLVQEALTNISKHAKAREVWVSLGQRDALVEVAVRDDGAGFDTQVQPASAYGLVGMRFRVEAEGGTLTVVSDKGQGTLIQVQLPPSTTA